MNNRNTNLPNLPSGLGKYLGLIAAFFFIIMLLSNTTFLTIDPGHRGVIFKRFDGGLVKDKAYEQGFHVIAPWNKMFIYDVRINEQFEKMDVLSKNGLNIEVELTYRFYPEPSQIGYLHDAIGIDYVDRIIKPEIRSATREVIGQYLPEELYSTKREAIQVEIFNKTKESIKQNFINLDAVLIRSVQLPVNLKNAIEQKLQEEQLSFQYEFKLDRERKEAERKIIEATLELAQSPNSKIVIIGDGGKGGLPLILNGN